MTAAALPARRSYGLGRIQIIGLIYGFFGVGLLAYVAPNLEAGRQRLHVRTTPEPGHHHLRPAQRRRRDRRSCS